jgi:hypothetical protein
MSLRFRRSVKLFPGVRLNLGLHGAGVSVGTRGLHVGMNRRGRYASAGIPGTGVYAVHHFKPTGGHPEVTGHAPAFLVGFCVAGLAVLVMVLATR